MRRKGQSWRFGTRLLESLSRILMDDLLESAPPDCFARSEGGAVQAGKVSTS